ncbi:MAG TPA: glycosyltransferase family 2 protein [Euryarchaeota archaeon]|nr:glycosyltransferase family 2 protein [Euryarchaeota archaeon]
MRITVIIPTMNEEESIGLVLDEVNETLAKIGGGGEVLIVDTNSKDRTREIAREKGARVIDEPQRGYGRAYKTGFKKAKGELIATLDADMTYPARDIEKFVQAIEKYKLDFITTDRLSEMEEGAMNSTHRLGNWVLVTTMNILFNMKLKDSQSGMWVFKRNILKKLKLTSDGMPLSEEIKIEAWRRGLRCREFKIRYRPRVGEVKLNTWKDGFRNLFFLFKKRLG